MVLWNFQDETLARKSESTEDWMEVERNDEKMKQWKTR